MSFAVIVIGSRVAGASTAMLLARNAGAEAIFEFTTALAALTTSRRRTAWLNSLAGRPGRIDELVALFAGTVSSKSYFSAVNAVRVLGARRAAELALGPDLAPLRRCAVGPERRPDLTRSR